MLGFGATGQFAIGQVGTVTGGAENITPDKWFQPLSIPVRFRPGLRAAQQQFAALPDAFPFVPFAWYEDLAKPSIVARPALRTGEIPFFTFQPMPSPFVATGWFEALAEPVRFRRGLRPSQQPFFASDTTPIPVSKLVPWFQALAEPVRFRQGLAAARQQFLAEPSRLLPTPTSFGVLNALETKDVFTGSARMWIRVVSAEVGVIESNFTGAEIGVSPLRQTTASTGAIETVLAPASGSPIAAITKASVSIRIV